MSKQKAAESSAKRLPKALQHLTLLSQRPYLDERRLFTNEILTTRVKSEIRELLAEHYDEFRKDQKRRGVRVSFQAYMSVMICLYIGRPDLIDAYGGIEKL